MKLRLGVPREVLQEATLTFSLARDYASTPVARSYFAATDDPESNVCLFVPRNGRYGRTRRAGCPASALDWFWKVVSSGRVIDLIYAKQSMGK